MEEKEPEYNFSAPQEMILTSTQDINLFLAGVGSGKTHLSGFISGYLVSNFPQCFGFIGANTYNQLSTSTLFRTFAVWEEMFNLRKGVDFVVDKKPPRHFNTEGHNYKSYNGIISFASGCVVYAGSLDNAKAHDGKEFTWAMLDETKDSREDDVKETILTRLRMPGIYVCSSTNQLISAEETDGQKNRSFNPIYIFTSPAKVDWINEWFELSDKQTEIAAKIFGSDDFYVREWSDKCAVVSSTYHNEKNLPDGYIEKILNNNTADKAKKLIYGNPFVKSGGEFYSGFNRLKHVKLCPYDPELPVHVSFDQNVRPYITATLYQIHRDDETKKRTVKQFAELCLSNPKNRSSKLCLELIRLHGPKMKRGLFYYGDPSGRRRDTRSGVNDYEIIEKYLKRYLNNASDRVPWRHPPVIARKDFINNIFEGVYPDIDFFIDPSCKESIKDLEFVKEDVNGKKHKEKAKDDSGNQYEKYGHTSDSLDYFICKAFERKFDREFS